MVRFILELIASIIGTIGFYFSLCATIKAAEKEKDIDMFVGLILTLGCLLVALYPWLN
jgi:uncharacterized protein with PQ loop repeat